VRFRFGWGLVMAVAGLTTGFVLAWQDAPIWVCAITVAGWVVIFTRLDPDRRRGVRQ
jgi:hypothetical protein